MVLNQKVREKMKKSIILSLLALIIGIATGSVGVMAYFGSGMAKSVFMFQEMEVFQFEQTAEDAYKNQLAEVAIWALENTIKSLNRIKEQRASADTEDPYILLTPDISLVLSHGRLAKLYKKLNNEEKYNYHIEKAVSVHNRKGMKITTDEEMLEYINKLEATNEVDQEDNPKQKYLRKLSKVPRTVFVIRLNILQR